MADRVAYWLELSDYDLETAKAMLSSKRYLYVGFMCHQTIEKAIKAYHCKHRADAPPFTHSLTLLARGSGLSEHLSDGQRGLIDILEPLNIEARYPTYKENLLKSLTQERCKQILKDTEALQQWIKQR